VGWIHLVPVVSMAHSTANSGVRKFVSEELNQAPVSQEGLYTSKFSDHYSNISNLSHGEEKSKPATYLFSWLLNKAVYHVGLHLTLLNCCGYYIIPPDTIFKNLVISHSPFDLRILHVSSSKQLLFP
jgi:hypothetical protein